MERPPEKPFVISLKNPRLPRRLKFDISRVEDFSPLYQVILADTYSGLAILPGDVVLDAGANSGAFTTMAAQLVGPSGLVISIEPEEANFRQLEKNVRLNGLPNVRLFKGVLWNEDGGKVRLEGRGIMARAGHGDTTAGGASADTFTLSQILSEAGVARLNKVKMDIEGSEELVLFSPKSTAIFDAEEIAIEFHSKYGAQAIRELLTARGYREGECLPRSEDLVSLLRGSLLNPISTLHLEYANEFRSVRRLLGHFVRIALRAEQSEFFETAFFSQPT